MYCVEGNISKLKKVILFRRTQNDLTPLQLAIKCGVAPVVEELCKKGVDMSVTDEKGDCSLWIALSSGLEDIASILVK